MWATQESNCSARPGTPGLAVEEQQVTEVVEVRMGLGEVGHANPRRGHTRLRARMATAASSAPSVSLSARTSERTWSRVARPLRSTTLPATARNTSGIRPPASPNVVRSSMSAFSCPVRPDSEPGRGDGVRDLEAHHAFVIHHADGMPFHPRQPQQPLRDLAPGEDGERARLAGEAHGVCRRRCTTRPRFRAARPVSAAGPRAPSCAAPACRGPWR